MRGIFTAGVLDGFAEGGEPAFDLVIGVSAGAYCASSYLAGQHGRIRRIITNQMTGWNYANPYRMLLGKSAIDQDYLMEVTRSVDPLDIDAMCASPAQFEVVATEAQTGVASYLPAKGDDALTAIHATVALPFFYRGGPIRFRGEEYFDGSVSDPVPIDRVIAQGATHVTVVLTRSRPMPRLSPLSRLFLSRAMARYPAVVRAIATRHRAFDAALRKITVPPEEVRFRLILPPTSFGVTRLTRHRETILEGYEIGLRVGRNQAGRY